MSVFRLRESFYLGWILTGILLASLAAVLMTFAVVSLKIEMGAESAWQESKLYHMISNVSGMSWLHQTIAFDKDNVTTRPDQLNVESQPRYIQVPVSPSRGFSAVSETQALSSGVAVVSQPQIRPHANLSAPVPAAAVEFDSTIPKLADLKFKFKPPKEYTAHWRIARFAVAQDIEDYEPTNILGTNAQLYMKPGQYQRLYWFNELVDSKGEGVTQSWYYNNTLMSRVFIDIQSNRWRASSFKTLSYRHQGEWRVATEDANGQVLVERRFELVLAE